MAYLCNQQTNPRTDTKEQTKCVCPKILNVEEVLWIVWDCGLKVSSVRVSLTAIMCFDKSVSLFTSLSGLFFRGCTPPVYTVSTLWESGSETLMLIDPSEEVWTQVCCRRPWLWHGYQGIQSNWGAWRATAEQCHQPRHKWPSSVLISTGLMCTERKGLCTGPFQPNGPWKSRAAGTKCENFTQSVC